MSADKPVNIPSDDEDFIIEKAVDGYQPDEIAFLIREEQNSHVAQDSITEFLDSGYADKQIDMRRRVRERKADVGREELISDLKEVKDNLITRSEELRKREMDEINNEKISTLISNIKLLGEFIGELRQKEKDSGGVVNVNKLEQNFNVVQAVQYMPEEDKKEVAQQLADDPSVEDFAIVKEEA